MMAHACYHSYTEDLDWKISFLRKKQEILSEKYQKGGMGRAGSIVPVVRVPA
jgi:hypothetical protein